MPPARPSRNAAVEPFGPLCDRLRSGRVVEPRIVLNDRLRWSQTLFVDHLWAGWQHPGKPPRGRDPLGAERGARCIRLRACGRNRRQRRPLQRGGGDVVRACFVAAAVRPRFCPLAFFGILLGNFEATQARAVSPRGRQRGIQEKSYSGFKGTPKQTNSKSVSPVSGIICETHLPLILGICFSTRWRMQLC